LCDSNGLVCLPGANCTTGAQRFLVALCNRGTPVCGDQTLSTPCSRGDDGSELAAAERAFLRG
jgi:hypothetical protein